jgi:hypothetical protein
MVLVNPLEKIFCNFNFCVFPRRDHTHVNQSASCMYMYDVTISQPIKVLIFVVPNLHVSAKHMKFCTMRNFILYGITFEFSGPGEATPAALLV